MPSGTYISNYAKISMQSFRWVEKDAFDTKTVHCCNNFFADFSTLSNAADDDLSTTADRLGNNIDCIIETLLSDNVSLI